MEKIAELKKLAERHAPNNIDVYTAIINYFWFLYKHPGDYAGATKEAAYYLELSDIDEFKTALKNIAIIPLAYV